jgi:hypothetical protein
MNIAIRLISAACSAILLCFFVYPPLFPAPMSIVSSEHDAFALHHMVRRVEAAFGELNVPKLLFGFDEFVAIYMTPHPYLAEALRMIASPEISDDQKIIVGYAMKNLNDSSFLGFSEFVLHLRRAGSIGQDVYDNVVFSDLLGTNIWIRRITDPAVEAYLEKASMMPDISSQRLEYFKEELTSEKDGKSGFVCGRVPINPVKALCFWLMDNAPMTP